MPSARAQKVSQPSSGPKPSAPGLKGLDQAGQASSGLEVEDSNPESADEGPKDDRGNETVLMIVVLAFLSVIALSIEGGTTMVAVLSIQLVAHILVALFERRAQAIFPSQQRKIYAERR